MRRRLRLLQRRLRRLRVRVSVAQLVCEVAGFVALIVAGALIRPAVGWAVAGVGLLIVGNVQVGGEG